MKKKAYLRTIEALMAVLLTFLFVFFVFPKSQTQVNKIEFGVLSTLENEETFRNCVLIADYNCTYTFLRRHIPQNYDFVFDINDNPGMFRTNLPEKNINTETLYIAGNITFYNPKFLRIYYWRIE
ncbi:MAG: hypothetical protein QXG86_01040 [Candidatus Woesearchaeota archaeon]